MLITLTCQNLHTITINVQLLYVHQSFCEALSNQIPLRITRQVIPRIEWIQYSFGGGILQVVSYVTH